MRYVWSLAVCVLVYAACGGESDDGGGGTGGASDAGAGGDGQTFKTACVAPTTDGGCNGLCGNDYPWNCGFAFCQGAPKGAQFCMGA